MPVESILKNGAVYITFDEPPVNALSIRALNELKNHLAEAAQNDAARSIVLQSRGRTFCAGASFDELIRLENMAEAVEFFNGFGRVINQMRKAPKPVIVRIQGKTVGGGNGLAAAGDLVLATDQAAFKLSELSLGIGPYVISPAIRRRGGAALLHRMAWQPWRWFSAFDMQKAGMVDHVFESTGAMDDYIDEATGRFAGYDARALAEWKETLWADARSWDELLPEMASKSALLLLRRPVKEHLQRLKK